MTSTHPPESPMQRLKRLVEAADPAHPPLVTLQPPGWPAPKGYANGVLASGATVFVGGQIGWDTSGRFPEGLVAQVRQTLLNTLAILAEAGAGPQHVVRMTWYVCSVEDYLANLPAVGRAYRETFGKHFPAMALVQVVRLVEQQALVEIETTAVLG
jgi:enamine deaminase RidA (YjgF/YER057c/UK114 family)